MRLVWGSVGVRREFLRLPVCQPAITVHLIKRECLGATVTVVPYFRIARERKPITADTALQLGKFLKTGAAFWMNIQTRFDLETAEDALEPQIKKITGLSSAA